MRYLGKSNSDRDIKKTEKEHAVDCVGTKKKVCNRWLILFVIIILVFATRLGVGISEDITRNILFFSAFLALLAGIIYAYYAYRSKTTATTETHIWVTIFLYLVLVIALFSIAFRDAPVTQVGIFIVVVLAIIVGILSMW